MNRLILIGNGFDLAHDLPTKYEDFINWYWKQIINELYIAHKEDTHQNRTLNISNNFIDIKVLVNRRNEFNTFLEENKDDITYSCINKYNLRNGFINPIFDIQFKSSFFERICNGIENKGWVDIEYDYYKLLKDYAQHHQNQVRMVKILNKGLTFLRKNLIEYLKTLKDKITSDIVISDLKDKIYAPIQVNDIAIANEDKIIDHINYWRKTENADDLEIKLKCYGLYEPFYRECLKTFNNNILQKILRNNINIEAYNMCLLPDQIMFLNFNYTETSSLYYIKKSIFSQNHIHGELKKPESVIFGYGDELDEYYKEIQNKNENEYLTNVKSIKYLESDNYRRLLSFIESAPFQVFVMGHSCGLSDRTLLNTIFEHKNCVSIKPFYHKKEDNTDNYLEIVQNISRNFNDMKLMRDRVVSKPNCDTI